MEDYRIILEKLEENGKEAYLVGGYVRDLLLGLSPIDCDIATNALPEKTEQIFSDYPVIRTGIKHGTVTVLLHGQPYEITTYRLDGNYSDRRHPDSVQFTASIEEDLSRRDFTVNAMALSQNGKIIDPYGGRADLKKRIIRCVGDPWKRFEEDALRILRALRFSSVFGFPLEEKTAKAAKEQKEALSLISKERLFSELKKALCGKDIQRVLIEYWDIFSALIKELQPLFNYDQHNYHHCFPLHIHTAKTVAACPSNPSLRLAGLLHDVGKPLTRSFDEQGTAHYYGHAEKSREIAQNVLNELKADNTTKEEVLFLVGHHDSPAEKNVEEVKRRLSHYGEEKYRALIDLRRADNSAQSEDFKRTEQHDRCLEMLSEILESQSCFALKNLKINGDDLLALGFPKGSLIGQTLSALLDGVITEKYPNNREELHKIAKNLLDSRK